jgi:hypothetical protein
VASALDHGLLEWAGMSLLQLVMLASLVLAGVLYCAASFAGAWTRTERELEHLERLIRNRRAASRVPIV